MGSEVADEICLQTLDNVGQGLVTNGRKGASFSGIFRKTAGGQNLFCWYLSIRADELVTFKYEGQGVATLEDGLYVLEDNLKDCVMRRTASQLFPSGSKAFPVHEEQWVTATLTSAKLPFPKQDNGVWKLDQVTLTSVALTNLADKQIAGLIKVSRKSVSDIACIEPEPS